MSEPKKRVCIIGGGPTGMCALYHLKLLAGDTVDIKCYEKQTNWRGMWNYTWRTGRWTKGKCGDLTGSVDFRHVVHNVEYREETDDFAVLVRDLRGQTDKVEIFSHVTVATGNFSVANIPDFPGIDTFPGRILHAKDFRNALAFKGKSVLVIGGSFSASEIAIQLIKYKCSSHVVISNKKARWIQTT